MADFTPVALQIKPPPDAMKTFGEVLGAANAAQQFQSQWLALQKGRATLESDIARNKAETLRAQTAATGEAADLQEKQNLRGLAQNGFKEFLGPDGQMDFNKLVPAVMQAAPTKGSEFVGKMYEMHSAFNGAKASLLKLNNDQRSVVAQQIYALANDSPENAKKKLDALVEQTPQLKPAADSAWKYQLEPASKDPAAFKQAAMRVAQGVLSVGEQNEATAPGGVTFNSGQQSGVINTKPMAGPTGVVPGTVVQAQLPPTTQVYNPQTKAPELVGPQGGMQVQPGEQARRDETRLQLLQQERQAATDPATQAALDREIAQTQHAMSFRGRFQTGPALGEAEGAGGTVATMNTDFAESQKQADKAQQNISVLQNVKKYAKGAATGFAADRRALANAIGDYLGISSDTIAKTDTDLLAKNANMLALAGGNTDAARSLAEAANPNVHMNAEAIRRAADQIISQQRMTVEKHKFLQPFKEKNDANAYSRALAEWNQNADPRALQLSSMTPEEKKQMRASMSDKEWADFKKKALWLHEKGIE